MWSSPLLLDLRRDRLRLSLASGLRSLRSPPRPLALGVIGLLWVGALQCSVRAQGDWFVAATPAARSDSQLAYDSVRGRVVMFGGSAMNDTWETGSLGWHRRSPGFSPPARSDHVLFFGPIRNRTILFGGENGTAQFFGDTWEYDGATWTQRAVIAAPYVRHAAAMAFDSARGRCVLHRGESVGPTLMGDTLEFGPPCDVIGRGHPGGGGPCSCSSVGARLGLDWCVNLGSNPLGLALVAVRFGGCLSTPIPLGPTLLCTPGLVLQAGGCFRLSDALSVVVQPW